MSSRARHLSRRTVASAALAGLLAVLSAAAAAHTITVAPGGGADYQTIQGGLGAAGNGDTVLVFPGVYPEHIYMGSDADGVVLMSSAGPDSTVVDGEGVSHSSVIHCEQLGPATLIKGFTVRGGWSNWYGGGIRCDQADITIEGNVFVDNWAAPIGGGGVGASGSSITVRDCRFVGNRGGDGGGIVVLYGSAVIERNEFSGNAADMFTGGQSGGAISIYGCAFVELSDNTITDNWALGGGGVQLRYVDEVVVQGNVISGNYSGYSAGGISVHHSCGEITGNVIADNFAYADYAGAMYLSDSEIPPLTGQLLIEDNVFFGNTANPPDAIAVRWTTANTGPRFHSNYFADGTQLQVRILGSGAPDTLDFTGNWWNTDDPVAISERILDHNDDPSLPWVVDFSGWCTDPTCSGHVTGIMQGLEQEVSWARLKAFYR